MFYIPEGYTHDIILFIVSLVVQCVLLVILFFHKSKRLEHKLLLFLIIFFIIWGTAQTSSVILVDDQLSLYAGKLTFFGPYWIPYIVLVLSLSIVERWKNITNTQRMLLLIPPIFFSLLTFSDAIVSGQDFKLDRKHPEYGVLYPVFAAYIFTYFMAVFAVISRGVRRARGKSEKRRLKYFLWGFILSASIAVTTNLILPAVFYNWLFGFVGPFGTIFFLTIVFLASIKYQLFNMRIELRRALEYVLSLLGILFFSIVVLQFKELLTGEFSLTQDAFYVSLLVIIAILYYPLQKIIQHVLAHVILNDEIDVFERFNFSEYLKQKPENLQKFSEEVVEDLGYKFRTDDIYLLLWDESLSLYKQYCKAKKNFSLSSSDPIIHALEVFKRHFHIETIAKNPKLFGIDENIVRECEKRMRQIQINFAIPLLSFDRIIGVILVNYHDGSDSMPDYRISRLADELVHRLSIEFWESHKFSAKEFT